MTDVQTPRQRMQEQLAAALGVVRADTSWTATNEQHAAHIVRDVFDPYVADSPTQRELAAVRGAANRTIDGLQAENQTLRARLAAREGVAV
jgi:hypothetical protein